MWDEIQDMPGEIYDMEAFNEQVKELRELMQKCVELEEQTNASLQIALEADKQLMALLMQPASPNETDRFQLVENYVDHIIDGMDTDSLVYMVRDLLTREYDKLTWDEITDEIVELYDEDTLIDLIPDAS